MELTKEIADLLNRCDIDDDLIDIFDRARLNNVVIALGYSDDNLELRGAIRDELGAYGGKVYYFVNQKPVDQDFIDDSKEVLEKIGISIDIKTLPWIKADWKPLEIDASWLITTSFQSCSFDLFEGDELFCRGVVFALQDVK